MQTVALMNAISALTFAPAPAALFKDDGKKKRLKTDIPSYDNLTLNSYDLSLDNYEEIIDLNNYEDIYDYGDLAPKIEVGTLAPPTKNFPQPLSTAAVPAEAPQSKPSSSTASRTKGPDLFGPITNITKLKRIDLSNNFISWVDDDSFQLLPSLQELILPGNKLTSLPELPTGIVQLDARFNMIQNSGIQPEAFQDLKKLQFLYLAGNKLDYIPVPLPEGLRSLHLQNNNIQILHEDTFCNSSDHGYICQALEDICLDGNPINLSLFPNAYFCLPSLPTGHFY